MGLAAMPAGCSDDAGGADAVAAIDAAAAIDATEQGPDAAADIDGGALLPRPGFGAISGQCGTIDGMDLGSPDPQLIHNVIDFADMPYTDADLGQLTAGGQEIYNDGNAGGSSLYSEIFAYEVLDRCELAVLLKTETEIIYDTPGKITDLLVEIGGLKVGVSVTRAYGFPPDAPYTVEQAQTILLRKLADISESTANVSAEDAWVKQILHVIAYQPMHAESMAAAWDAIDPAVRSNTIVVVTVSSGQDGFLY